MEPQVEYARRLAGEESDPLLAARRRAGDAIWLPPPELGALLRWAAAMAAAQPVVEVGSAAGVSGLWLLRGMDERGVLTSIEPDPEVQAWASRAYDEGGVADRVRSILGAPATVLPRLSDAGYDLVVLQTVPSEYPVYLAHARRLLRPGGLLLALATLAHGRVPEATARDDGVEALREFNKAIGEDRDLVAALLPVAGGVTVATARPASARRP